MARSNGPFGPAGARPPARRHPADAHPPQPQSPHQYADPGLPPAPSQGYHFPPEPEPNFGHNGQQPGQYDQYQAHDPYAQAQWGQQDQRGYDLGNYTPNGAQPYANGAGYPNAPQGFPNVGPPFANGAQSYGGAADPYPQMDDPPFQTGGAGHHDPYAQQGYADGEGEYEDELVEERSGRGRRWMFIVAALVGAVGVGGALAYTYKSFMAPSAGRVPLVKADPNVKVKADNRTLPSNDRRQQGRLGEDDAAQRAAAATDAQDDRGGDEPGGPRRVRTIPITPGGAPPGIQVSHPPPVQAGAPPVVPGIMLDNMAPRAQQPPPAPAAAPPQRVVIGQPPPQTAPQAQEQAPPPVRKVAVPAAQAAPPPPRPAPQAAPASRTVAPAPAQASTGAGYVAVLSSQKTRMDALKAFADLQQKYGEALSGRVPDVQEADLGAKGVWYRVVVGPPGSRDAANGVCSQLKSAGYGHCWVNAY